MGNILAYTWTESDLEDIKAAIKALATGTRVVRVSVEGESTEYGQADINSLMSLYERAVSQYQAENSTCDYFLTRTEKGL